MSELSEAVRNTLATAAGPAFEFDGIWVDWRQAARLTDEVRQALAALSLPPASRVGFIARNRLAPTAAYIALQADDHCAIPLNPFQSETSLAADIRRLGLAAIVGAANDLRAEALLAADAQAGAVAIDAAAKRPVTLLRPPSFDGARTTPDCAILLPTSGTTGAPKRIPIRADSWMATLKAGGRGAAVTIQYSPLAHIAGALVVSGAAIRGGAVVMLEKFTVDGWLDAVRRHRPVSAGLPPTMMRMVMTAGPDPADLASLKVISSGQAPVDWNLAREFERKYDVIVVGNYGATEFCGPIATGTAEDRERFGDAKWGSVGRFRRDLAEPRIVDRETGAPMAPGEVGVLEVRVFRMGPDWIRTTDLASLDADDFLYIHGRTDDAIIRGGFKIVPEVVAEALRDYPGVADVAVVGRPDERLGAAPVAAVEMRPGAPAPSEDDLLQFARSRLLSYQSPVAVRVVDALPRTPTLKVDRRRVIELFQPDEARGTRP
jgi:acyl-CoA synthetase (AMP-forming)/AMP-acid ligase II